MSRSGLEVIDDGDHDVDRLGRCELVELKRLMSADMVQKPIPAEAFPAQSLNDQIGRASDSTEARVRWHVVHACTIVLWRAQTSGHSSKNRSRSALGGAVRLSGANLWPGAPGSARRWNWGRGARGVGGGDVTADQRGTDGTKSCFHADSETSWAMGTHPEWRRGDIQFGSWCDRIAEKKHRNCRCFILGLGFV